VGSQDRSSERLARRVAPEHTAVVCMEMQRGVVGDLSRVPALASAVRDAGLVEATASLLGAARRAGVRVVFCTAAFRADRAGTHRNVPLIEVLLEDPDHMRVGSEEVEVIPALAPEPADLVCQRFHGISPFAGTALDATLRAEGVTTVVATGVSLNLGVLGLAIEAVNHGYRVVIPTDCVVGVPAEYGEQVLRRSLAHIATLTTSRAIIEAW
jgi:nicotinamidase-related amidase